MFSLPPPRHIPTLAAAVIAAGLAGGFADWVIAGWNAGFWKPVSSRETALPPPTAASRPPQIR